MVYYVVINAINFNNFNNHMGITASAYKLQEAINNKWNLPRHTDTMRYNESWHVCHDSAEGYRN